MLQTFFHNTNTPIPKMAPLRTCLALLSLLVLASSSGAKGYEPDLISTACNRTLHQELCISSLRSDPRSHSSDLEGLAEIALNISTIHGVQTLSYINHLKSNVGGNVSEYVLTCLSDCMEEYSEAIDKLEDSVGALMNRSFDDLVTFVTAAMTDSDTCEEGFEENPEEVSPLTKRNQDFSMLCSNFLAITTLLHD
ncbi:putative invertase inhibitor [Tripterygium wilfordii]|uniref:putative invertase inhibitor n=1 Tax=Tripterygium wilfordii TaxID=458696 RepID=UPI0018F82F98|nr:putative invertase inhibitor [Tripterygium wilfordii]